MKSLISNVLIPSLLIIQSCSSSRTAQQSSSSRKQYSKVSLENLLDSVDVYQNKRIETLGYYVCGAEHTSIQPAFSEQNIPDQKLYDWTQRLWVEVKNPRSVISCDSVNKRTVVVRGILDTSRHGHLGEYEATLKHAVIELR
jgi:hypothetical protein